MTINELANMMNKRFDVIEKKLDRCGALLKECDNILK